MSPIFSQTEDCTTAITCNKCQGNHNTNKCDKNLPIKCGSCNSTDHQAWSFKCPRRPTKPIDGIPNIPVTPLNKKSYEIDDYVKENTKIHSPVTIHDYIINTYARKLNKPENANREELVKKLKRRFIKEYNIDTSLVFPAGNKFYIFMFDLDNPEQGSPTKSKQGNVVDVHLQ